MKILAGSSFGVAIVSVVAMLGAPQPARADDNVPAKAIQAIGERLEEMREASGVNALYVGIATGETVQLIAAAGTSMAGVPARTDMHFRIGAMAIASMTTVLMQLVDEGVVSLDDTIDRWLPNYPAADKVTLRMLADCTSGYADYVPEQTFIDAFYEDVFRVWPREELLKIAFDLGMQFEPGTDFLYSHTSYIVLGEALEAAAGVPYLDLLQERIIDRLGLSQTKIWHTAELPAPALHAFVTERGFLEDSTYWSPSWTSYTGPLNSDLGDLVRLMRALAVGETLSPESLETMLAPTAVGIGGDREGRYFSLGMEIIDPWIEKKFMFGGYGGMAGYLPAADLTLAVVTTLGPDTDSRNAGDEDEDYDENPAAEIFKEISAALGH